MKPLLTAGLLMLQLFANAQKREEIFDYTFKPAKGTGGYYFVTTEKKDSGWYRTAFYISYKTQYMDGWYGDDSCKIKHGEFRYFHRNKMLHEIGRYENNEKEGPWIRLDEEGKLTDSSNYRSGRKRGVSLGFHSNGYVSDSTHFDDAGNGVQLRWYDDGAVFSAGRWRNDTSKSGRWKYYHRNGTVKATEDYGTDGKLLACNCYDSTGAELDKELCSDKEAKVDIQKWRRYLEQSLQSLVDQKSREGISGHFTVMVRFLISKEGKIEDVKALTAYGHGIEEAVVKIMKNGPDWTPGSYQGQKVRSYHTQPITFMISDGR